jgi:hypothetical protein
MKHLLVATLLAAPTLLWAAPASEIGPTTGLWKIDGDVHGRPVHIMCQLTQTERKLSGSCSNSAQGASPHTIDGSVKGQKMQFHLQTSMGGNSLTLVVSGRLTPDSSRVAGDLEVEPMGVGGKFEGERTHGLSAEAAAQPPTPASPATPSTQAPTSATGQDATGTWNIDADFQGTAAELTCVLKQNQAALTGTCTGDDNKANAITGEVNDHGLKWHFESEYQGQPITVTITAKLSADGATMQGDAAVAPLNAEGTFTGKREAPTPPEPASTLPVAPPTAETLPAQ